MGSALYSSKAQFWEDCVDASTPYVLMLSFWQWCLTTVDYIIFTQYDWILHQFKVMPQKLRRQTWYLTECLPPCVWTLRAAVRYLPWVYWLSVLMRIPDMVKPLNTPQFKRRWSIWSVSTVTTHIATTHSLLHSSSGVFYMACNIQANKPGL